MEASGGGKTTNYERDALRALGRARKAVGSEDLDPQEQQYLLAAANVYASLELASALKSQGTD